MADQSGITTYTYDNLDRLVEKASSVGRSIHYAYDPQGNLTNLAVSSPASSVQGRASYSYDTLNRLKHVIAPAGLTAYDYDTVGNLQSYIYPNGVSHFYEYDRLNRLTNMSMNHLTVELASYSYSLNPSGHRLSERSTMNQAQRTVSYTYDSLYRLTSETVSGALIAGKVSYTYDPVGNRLTRNSTLANVLTKLYSYNMNDLLGFDTYDANGNTVEATLRDPASSVERQASDTYDFENRLISRTTSDGKHISIVYDGDGNRVSKTVNGSTTYYLVDTHNLTGYAQVLEELSVIGDQLSVTRSYTYGLDLISQTLITDNQQLITSFFGYDGHGNTRFLTDATGLITDRYHYDAFGTLIEQQVFDPAAQSLVPVAHDNRYLMTDNCYLYCGEQFDPDLGMYFLRARYMDTDRGRFWTMDMFEGFSQDPHSLHKYLYAHANPVSGVDPSGHLYVGISVGAFISNTMRKTSALHSYLVLKKAQAITAVVTLIAHARDAAWRAFTALKEAAGIYPWKPGGGGHFQPYSALSGQYVSQSLTFLSKYYQAAGSQISQYVMRFLEGYHGGDYVAATSNAERLLQCLGDLLGRL